MKQTELVFILDRSGSMHGLEADTIGGFNLMLDKQKEAGTDCRVTTVLFNHEIKTLHDRIPLGDVAPMTEKDFSVGGMTALCDAIGTTIDSVRAAQKRANKVSRADQVLFVIITDGLENASKEYSSKAVKKKIKKLRDKGWEFIFLGANIDAVETADHLGISRDCAADYLADEEGTELNFKAISKAVSAYCESGEVPIESLESIREDVERRRK